MANIKQPPKLNTTSYHAWSIEMENYLAQTKLKHLITYQNFEDYYKKKHVVSDQEKRYINKVAALRDLLDAKSINKEKYADNLEQIDNQFHNDLSLWSSQKAKSQENWNTENEQVIGIIRSCIDITLTSSVEKIENAYELWIALKKESSLNDVGTALVLFCQWFGAVPQKGEKLTDYLNRVHTIFERIKNLGKKIPDDLHCYKILSSLPQEFEQISISLFQTPEDELNINLLKKRFGLEDSRRMTAKNEQKKANRAQVSSTNVAKKCSICNNILPKDHNPRYKQCNTCYEKNKKEKDGKKKEKNKKESKEEKGNAAIRKKKNQKKKESNSEVSSSASSCLARAHNASKTSSASNSSWYIDSGCTNHITNVKKDLNKMKKISNFSIEDAHGEKSLAKLQGDARIGKIDLLNTVYDPSFVLKLASVQQICNTPNDNVSVLFTKDTVFILRNAEPNGTILQQGEIDATGLYAIKANAATTPKVTLMELHERLGHSYSAAMLLKLEDYKITD
jgi:chemotaxis protein histidine kinase CheA